jgi:hypothetical protein
MFRIMLLAAEWFLVYFVIGFLLSTAWLITSLWRQKRANTTAYSLESQARTHP